MKDKRNLHGTVGKSSSEQHLFKSTTITFILCEISGAVHLVQPGFTAGKWQAGSQMNCRLISKFLYTKTFDFSGTSFSQGTASCIPGAFFG